MSEVDLARVKKDSDLLPYHKIGGSIWFMIAILLGQTEGTDSFSLGNPSMTGYLYFIYFFSSSLIVILMLNMLIAIMGDTFDKRKTFGKQITVKDHLGYVIDNWYLINSSFRQRKQIKYLITAYTSDDVVGDKQLLNQLHDEIN